MWAFLWGLALFLMLATIVTALIAPLATAFAIPAAMTLGALMSRERR